MKKNSIVFNALIFIFCFLCFILCFSAYWLKTNFAYANIEQILFHLRFPIIDKTTPFIKEFCIEVLLPSVILAFLVIYIRTAWLKSLLCIAIFSASIYIVESYFEIPAYLEKRKAISDFYEKYYVKFDSKNLANFTPKQNLIVILAESMESTYSAKNIPNANGGGHKEHYNKSYSPFGELIPNLSQIALENVNFSTNNALGGLNQLYGTSWTIAGIISYLCGIPLNMPLDDFTHEHFLESAFCVSNVFNDLGYKQNIIGGTDFSFAGKRNFFKSHHIGVMDLPYFQSQNMLPNPLPTNLQGVWGLKDSKLFDLAKQYLSTAQTPFVLYILNVDTHYGGGNFIDKEQCNIDASYQNAILCGDKIISDFIKWVQNSHLAENTTIIILGDHLSMQTHFFPENIKRFIYNAFINAKFMQTPTLELMKNRKLSHFDITPLLLDSLGIYTKAFGLGRNPLYGKTLLESEFSIDEFDNWLNKPNKIYDSFWEVKK